MSKPYGVPVRGQVEAAFGAGGTIAVQLFDHDGNIRTQGADERLDVTDISYRAALATNLHVFFDTIGDGANGQNAAATLVAGNASPATGIAAGTYNLAITYFDPYTNSETPLSASAAVTPTVGQQIMVTAPVAIPAYMKSQSGALGYIKVYRTDAGNLGLLGQSAPGANSVVITTVTPTGSNPYSGANASGKNVGTAYLSANAPWSDCFETGKMGPPGVGLKVTSSVATTVSVEISGRLVKNLQMP